MGFGRPLDVVRPDRARVPPRRVRAGARERSPTRRTGRSTTGRAPARSRRRGATTTLAAGELAGRDRRRAAHDDRRASAPAPRSCGSPPTGTARPSSSRRGISGRRAGGCSVHGDAPLDVDLPFPVPLDELGVVHARLHREPAGERGAVRVRGAARASSRRPICRRSRRPVRARWWRRHGEGRGRPGARKRQQYVDPPLHARVAGARPVRRASRLTGDANVEVTGALGTRCGHGRCGAVAHRTRRDTDGRSRDDVPGGRPAGGDGQGDQGRRGGHRVERPHRRDSSTRRTTG